MTHCKFFYYVKNRNFQPTKSAIRVGRSSDCEVAVDDNMLSRVHCTIEYRNNTGWVVTDGNLLKNKDGTNEIKHSTNGTW
jgi:pSer/pThr/pTyr-binding forkhead associated (FHA) protein